MTAARPEQPRQIVHGAPEEPMSVLGRGEQFVKKVAVQPTVQPALQALARRNEAAAQPQRGGG